MKSPSIFMCTQVGLHPVQFFNPSNLEAILQDALLPYTMHVYTCAATSFCKWVKLATNLHPLSNEQAWCSLDVESVLLSKGLAIITFIICT